MKRLTIVMALLIMLFSASVANAALSVGLDPISAGNALALRYDFTEVISGKLGLNYASVGGAATTGIGIQADYYLPLKLGAANTFAGINYNTNGAAVATTNISLILGAEVDIADGVKLSAGITPYNQGTTAGVNTGTLTTAGGWVAVYCKIN